MNDLAEWLPKDMKTKFLRSFPSSCYVARYLR
jgi:hypothetical protein